MIYTARELNAMCRHLALAGQNEDGELEWIGTSRQWSDLQGELNEN